MLYLLWSNYRELLCIPKSYQICHITDNILKPIQNELFQYFKGLKINKIKAKKANLYLILSSSLLPEDDMLPNGKYRIKKGQNLQKKLQLKCLKMKQEKFFRDLPEHYLKSQLKMKIQLKNLKNFFTPKTKYKELKKEQS